MSVPDQGAQTEGHLDRSSIPPVIPSTRPPDDSLFWKLWNSSESIAKAAYQTSFLQELQAGTLSPTTFGAFMISDIYYCFRGADSYKHVVDRTDNLELKAFLAEKRDSYKTFVDGFSKQWRVADPKAILPTKVAQEYADYEGKIARDEDPIYTLIVMLPCSHLWAWLGDQMTDHVKDNVYHGWIKDNQGMKGAYKMGNFIDLYEKEFPGAIDHDKAIKIFKQAMELEKENFASP